MAEPVAIAVVQPPYLSDAGAPLPPGDVCEAALGLLASAVAAGAELVVLPELLNVKNAAAPPALAESVPGPLSERVVEFCARHGCLVLLPLLERRDGRLFNSAHLLAPTGPAWRYDKVHLTRHERETLGLAPGDAFVVGPTPWGRVGVMTCYDAHFPETAACLALLGAEAILYPALERGLTADQIRLLVRARAWDHAAVVARASYGIPAGLDWSEGTMAGESCIVGKDGVVLASCGHHAGYAVAVVDLAAPRLQERSHGQEVGDIRAFHHADRRPEVYRRLVE